MSTQFCTREDESVLQQIEQIRDFVLGQKTTARKRRHAAKKDKGKHLRISDAQHDLLMDKAIIPFGYWRYKLTGAEEIRIKQIKSCAIVTRNKPRPPKGMLREYHRDIAA